MVCFFFNDTATTEIYTLSLHDALPIYRASFRRPRSRCPGVWKRWRGGSPESRSFARRKVASLAPSSALVGWQDRKSTRLNSSHANISYAVFCLKMKYFDIIASVDNGED